MVFLLVQKDSELLAETNFKCPKDHIDVRIQYSASNARDKGISETMDPYVYVVFWAPMIVGASLITNMLVPYS